MSVNAMLYTESIVNVVIAILSHPLIDIEVSVYTPAVN